MSTTKIISALVLCIFTSFASAQDATNIITTNTNTTDYTSTNNNYNLNENVNTSTNTNVNTSTATNVNNNSNVSVSDNNNVNTSTSVSTNNNTNISDSTVTSTSNSNNINVNTSTSNNTNTNINNSNSVINSNNTNTNTNTSTSVNENLNINQSVSTSDNNINQSSNSVSTNTNVNQNNNISDSTNTNYNENLIRNESVQRIEQEINSPPPSAIAPSIGSSYSQDLCTTGISGAVQTQIFGLSTGKSITDSNCERIKLSKTLYDMGMRVAAVSLMCQDERVWTAMKMAGTPCPYEGKIGTDAAMSWEENRDQVPGYNQRKDKNLISTPNMPRSR